MDKIQITELLQMFNWKYSEAEIYFMVMQLKYCSYQKDILVNNLIPAFHKKPDSGILIQKIKFILKTTEQSPVRDCPLCENKRKIVVYNYKASFPPYFDKQSLIKLPLMNFAVKIPCPECSNQATYRRYCDGMLSLSNEDREIVRSYFKAFHPELLTKELS